MTSARTQRLLPLACLATACLVGVAAIVDHHLKQRSINNAQAADYFCRVQHVRCGHESWRRIEERWQSRQLAYEIAVIVLGGLGVALVGYRLVRW